MVVIFLVAFCVLIGMWANNWGRNGLGWGLLALLISPLMTALILLVCGRYNEAQKEL